MKMTSVNDISYSVPGFPPIKPDWGFGCFMAERFVSLSICESPWSLPQSDTRGRWHLLPMEGNLESIFILRSFHFNLLCFHYLQLFYCNKHPNFAQGMRSSVSHSMLCTTCQAGHFENIETTRFSPGSLTQKPSVASHYLLTHGEPSVSLRRPALAAAATLVRHASGFHLLLTP